jgi:hypothetical protein
MTTRDSREQVPYVGQTDDELMQVSTVFRDGLLRGQVVLISGGCGGIGRAIRYLSAGGQAWGEFWPLGKPAHFRMED